MIISIILIATFQNDQFNIKNFYCSQTMWNVWEISQCLFRKSAFWYANTSIHLFEWYDSVTRQIQLQYPLQLLWIFRHSSRPRFISIPADIIPLNWRYIVIISNYPTDTGGKTLPWQSWWELYAKYLYGLWLASWNEFVSECLKSTYSIRTVLLFTE